MLDRTQVKLTRNSKKILRSDRNKRDSPQLRGKSCCCQRFCEWVVNKWKKIKTSKRNTTRTRVHLYTGRAPAARPVDWRRGFFFPWNCYVYPHLYKTPVRDQYYNLLPGFRDCHLILQFSKRLKDDKYGTILNKILDYITKISLIISYYFLGSGNL